MTAGVDLTTLVLKLLLVPTFIGIVSLAGRRWGSTLSGWLIGLPLTSGPVAFFLALEQGSLFASEASRGILMGIISVLVFCLVYSRLAIRFKLTPSILGGVISYFVCTYLLDSVNPSLLLAFLSVIGFWLFSLVLMPKIGADRPRSGSASAQWEIPLRMITATTLVLVITGIAQILGPQLTGLLTPFPIYATILVIFTHRLEGGTEAVKLVKGLVAGLFTFTVFFLVVSSTILPWGIGLSFMSAIGISLFTHAASLLVLKRADKESALGYSLAPTA